MLIIGIDTETNGASQDARNIDGKEDAERAIVKTDVLSEIVEVGLCLFHVEKRTVLASYSTVLKVEQWGSGAEIIHGISKDLSDLMPNTPNFDPWDIIYGDMADMIVAHNAVHDHPLVTQRWPKFKTKPWLCTREDLRHGDAVGPDGHKLLHRPVSSTRLGHLCVDYNIQLSGWHRALADAEACARMAACHDLNFALAYKNATKFQLAAYGKFIENISDLLKKAPSVINGGRRYHWDPEYSPKAWVKESLTESEVIADGEYIREVTNKRWDFSLKKMPSKTY